MALIVTNIGAQKLLDRTLRLYPSPAQELELRLFRNDYTPITQSQTFNFTEANFQGYQSEELITSLWQSAVQLGQGYAQCTYDTEPFEWLNTGLEQIVYGYYVVEIATNETWWAERFGFPRTVATGGSLSVQPRMTGVSEYDS